jgi:hypothetical protein
LPASVFPHPTANNADTSNNADTPASRSAGCGQVLDRFVRRVRTATPGLLQFCRCRSDMLEPLPGPNHRSYANLPHTPTTINRDSVRRQEGNCVTFRSTAAQSRFSNHNQIRRRTDAALPASTTPNPAPLPTYQLQPRTQRAPIGIARSARRDRPLCHVRSICHQREAIRSRSCSPTTLSFRGANSICHPDRSSPFFGARFFERGPRSGGIVARSKTPLTSVSSAVIHG